ncbi:MAG: CPBP family intramembrane metalloprotease [Oscillospiraceae bacterium]|nr:CPBP family intramembrane metalloprotease [Oscillospiraceae bacterium]
MDQYQTYNQYAQTAAAPDPFGVFRGEKRAIKKNLSGTFIMALIHGVGSFILAQIFFLMLMASGYEVQYNEENTLIVDWLYSLAGSMPSIIFCIVLFLVNKSILRQPLSGYLRTDKINGSFMVGTIGVVMFSYAVAIIMQLLAITGFAAIDLSPIAEEYMTAPTNDAPYLAEEVLTSIILAPIAEELMFRGVIMGRLSKVSRRMAIFVSAAFFGMMHGNLLQAILGFIVGIVFAYADLKAESLIPSIIGHMFINTAASSSSFIERFAGKDASDTAWTVTILMFAILGLITFLVVLFGRKISFPEYNEYHKKRVPIMFTCVSLWVTLIYYIFEIVDTFGPMTDKLRG